MNEFSAYAHRIRGGWWGMLRFARDAKPRPIMGKGEKPVVFPDELSATKAVLKHITDYFNGVGNHEFRRDGDRLTDYRSQVEEKFFKGSASPKPPKQRNAKCSRIS